MMAIISRKNLILFGITVLIMSSLSCNLASRLVGEPTGKPGKEPTEEKYIFPTKSQAAEQPTEEVVEVTTEIAATEAPVETLEEPTATVKSVKKTATRTVPPPTATLAVIRQSTQAVQPTLANLSSGDITVTAATGNLFVRRGPGTTYNIVAGFSKGVTTKAVGRNEKNDWLAIEIPLAKGAIGWISMGTGYTEMSGSIQSLPLYPYDEPKPAYIQNCTMHDMTTRPGQWNLPAKTTQKVGPGEYQILDMSTGQSKVQEIVLKEGNTVTIKTDGNGVSYGCP